MKNIFKHINLVMRHKRYVFQAMRNCGHPIQGMLHDLSKFSPTEFMESIKYYQGNRSPIEAAKEDKGYSSAWFHHRGRNKHHSQYWVDISFGEIIPCRIPWKYLVEHICDNIGAGKAYLKDKWTDSSPLDYYNKIDHKSFYHEHTRAMLEYVYKLISVYGLSYIFHLINNGVLEGIYENSFTDDIKEEAIKLDYLIKNKEIGG